MSPAPPSAPSTPRRRTVAPSNSLILLLPAKLFSPALLPLFEAHFASYGPVAAWTPLERLGRVLVVYESVEAATAARREMDGFVWEEDEEEQVPLRDRDTASPEEALRAFFGPALSLPLPSLRSTLLGVPALSRNFLISPPGSPPVGWEQTLEEAPNRHALPHAEVDAEWSDELARALRYLSVSSGGEDDDDGDDIELDEPGSTNGTHTTLVSAAPRHTRPSVTLSTPPSTDAPVFLDAMPPAGAAKITAVKATIESMLGRKKSFDELSMGRTAPSRVIIPTARPPTADEREFRLQ